MAQHYHGLQGSARAWLLADLHQQFQQIIVLCPNMRTCDELLADLRFFLPEIPVLHLPAWDCLPFEPVSPQVHISAERLRTLSQIAAGTPFVCVASVEGAVQRLMPQWFVKATAFRISAGDHFPRDTLLQRLIQAGYQRVSLVEDIGEFAVRGGVIDVFPPGAPQPVRLECLDDLVEQLKYFDPASQRSVEVIAEAVVQPVREIFDFRSDTDSPILLEQAVQLIKTRGRELETPPREIAKTITALKEAAHYPGMELACAIALAPLPSIFDLLPPQTCCAVVDQLGFTQALDRYWDLIQEREQRFAGQHYLVPDRHGLFLEPASLMQDLSRREQVVLDSIEMTSPGPAQDEQTVKITSLANTALATKLKAQAGTADAWLPLMEALEAWRTKQYQVAFVLGSPSRAERLQRILLENNCDARIIDRPLAHWLRNKQRYPLVIVQGHLTDGFQLPRDKLVFVSENELFLRRSYRSKTQQAKKNLKRLLSSLSQLKSEDYLVHEEYGVGRYRGLTHLTVEGIAGDFLHIDYADSRLYLPVQNIGKVQKYVGVEGVAPTLDRLGSTRWSRTKKKVRESVVSLAGDLIRLYAARSIARGWRFDTVGAEDERFADGFAFDETPDQMAAIADVLSDMAGDKPMDRLVCGDVGFGKTEVALRAAFKCIEHARQVAVLVPTTVLVEQHKQSFGERFDGYPLRIEAISRFYTAAQNRETLDGLQKHDIDIVIGTHKLLQRNVEFADLGLLIIDEEHRFGVKQKERLKQLKQQVDVLTLTATPIPRTLHMSLINVRDISVISTAPHDRRVIRTYIAARSDELIRDALLREHQRGGQVFFVHNRVERIATITAAVSALVPELRTEFAHGQMSERQLERIMHRFVNQEIDVLVCTTIIESGLDIPNANTIIIDRADMLGLAQLYQLRGRVGRSNKQAYAYFLIPQTKRLSAEAQKRLKVLQSLDDLGLGFNLAIRDLEIRGAGNLLGKEQSGNVSAIGYDLYCKILREAVTHLKGEELSLQEIVDPEVKLGVDAFIPETYIPDISERLVMYQRLAGITDSAEADELIHEMEDRFGSMGVETHNLTELMRYRGLLRCHGILKAELSTEKLLLTFSPQAKIDAEKILALTRNHPELYRFSRNLTLSVALEEPLRQPAQEVYSLTARVLKLIGA